MSIKIKHDVLRKIRDDLGYSRTMVEEATGIKAERIQAVEEGKTGTSKSTVHYVEKLCEHYNLPLETIINYDYHASEIICFGMAKGGTAKSTSVAEVAYHLSKKFKVLVIDGDPQSNVTRVLSEANSIDFQDQSVMHLAAYLRCPEHEISEVEINNYIYKTKFKNIDIIRSHPDLYMAANILKSKMLELGPYRVLREKLINSGKYDYILIDTSPYIDAATIGLYIIADKFFIPLNLEPFTRDSIPTFGNAIKLAKSSKVALFPNSEFKINGVFKTKVDYRKKVDKEISEFINQTFSTLVLSTEIPLFEGVKQAQYGSELISEFDNTTERGKLIYKAYKNLANEVIK